MTRSAVLAGTALLGVLTHKLFQALNLDPLWASRVFPLATDWLGDPIWWNAWSGPFTTFPTSVLALLIGVFTTKLFPKKAVVLGTAFFVGFLIPSFSIILQTPEAFDPFGDAANLDPLADASASAPYINTPARTWDVLTKLLVFPLFLLGSSLVPRSDRGKLRSQLSLRRTLVLTSLLGVSIGLVLIVTRMHVHASDARNPDLGYRVLAAPTMWLAGTFLLSRWRSMLYVEGNPPKAA